MHREDLVAYARRVLGRELRLAEDVVQEAYVRLLERGVGEGAPASARPWLFRVVRNLALDERRRARRQAIPLAECPDGGPASAAPQDLVERREEAGLVLREIAALPPHERRAVELDQAGVGASAIARALDTNPNAVHQVLFRARRRLRRARTAAWALLPLPLARLVLSAGDTRVPQALLAAAPGSSPGRLLPVAAVAGAVLTGLAGGGAVVQSLSHAPSPPPPAAEASARRSVPPASPHPPQRIGTRVPIVAMSAAHSRSTSEQHGVRGPGDRPATVRRATGQASPAPARTVHITPLVTAPARAQPEPRDRPEMPQAGAGGPPEGSGESQGSARDGPPRGTEPGRQDHPGGESDGSGTGGTPSSAPETQGGGDGQASGDGSGEHPGAGGSEVAADGGSGMGADHGSGADASSGAEAVGPVVAAGGVVAPPASPDAPPSP